MNKNNNIRILHHMARSGGTIISRCLGCMNNIALLSEIHPFGYENRIIDPLVQAHQWFNLLTQSDVNLIRNRQPFPFIDAIRLIKKRCDKKGLILVIRDWSHIDFTGWPHNQTPRYKLSTEEVLSKKFSVINTATVRHPIDQWLSFKESQSWTGTEMPLSMYLLGYRKFAEIAYKTGFLRYEDFVESPAEIMKQLCNNLMLQYDPDFINKWTQNKSVTTATRRRDVGHQINKRPRPEISMEILDKFYSNNDYKASIDLLGYNHPE